MRSWAERTQEGIFYLMLRNITVPQTNDELSVKNQRSRRRVAEYSVQLLVSFNY